MATDGKGRRRRLRKTKAELVAELEALDRRLAGGKDVAGKPAVAPPAAGDAYFRAIVRHSPTAIFVRDVDSRYILVNETYERQYKVSDEEIFGKTPFDVFERESAETIVAGDREVVEKGRRIEHENVVTLADGTVRVQWKVAFPFHDSQGNVIGVSGILTDLAEKKRAEQAVRVSEERLHAAIDSLREGFALFDADDRLVAFNEKYRQLRPSAQKIKDRGGTYEDLLRTFVADGLIPDAVGREEAFMRDRMERHRDPKGPIIRHYWDGTWCLISEARTPDGGTTLSIVDITELKTAETALRKSEALFRAVVNHSPTKIHIKDVEGRYTLINKEAEKLFGITDEEGRGKTSYDLFPKGVADAFMAHDRAVIESGRALEKEEEFTLDGDIRTFLTVKFPIYDLDGIAAVGAIATDITERKRAEEALRESEARLANILDNSPTPIYFKDPQGRFLVANKQYEKMYRVKFDDIRGRTSKQIFGGALGDQFYEHDQMVLKSRKVIEREERIFGRSYLTLKFPIVDHAGEILGLGGVETDVTEIKKAEKDLREAKEHAEFANRAKTEFLANMSHELRTPLNSIIGLSEILMSQMLGPLGSPKYREYAEDIRNSGDHLLNLISEVLDLSKIEAGELKIVESEIDVAGTVSTCVRMIEGRAPLDSPRVNVEFADGLPRLRGDERRFKQILLNLLGNAVKFTPLDGKVSVSARVCDGGRFTIEVADTGIGIAPKDIPKILEPFGQVRDVFTRNHEGTGLGLYLAKSFTEMHGGTLDISSAVGRGTKVTLRFPKERTVAR